MSFFKRRAGNSLPFILNFSVLFIEIDSRKAKRETVRSRETQEDVCLGLIQTQQG